jgi:hypothetical protein
MRQEVKISIRSKFQTGSLPLENLDDDDVDINRA